MSCAAPNKINIVSDIVPHFVVVDPSAATIGARASGLPPPPKLLACVGALGPRKFCEKLQGTYPSPIAPLAAGAAAGGERLGKLYSVWRSHGALLK
jgi:hypothetical protein